MKHTLLRKEDPGVVSHLQRHSLEDSAVCRFLRFWNGLWESRVITHYCDGCCDGPETTWHNLYSSANEIDLLQSKESELPCLDDWGTCGIASGKSALGILCHEVICQVAVDAIPSWRGAVGGDDPIDQLRMKIQKKAWRTKCVLQSPSHKLRIVVSSWLGAPVERLQSHLIYLDEAGKGLLDTVFLDELNPFHQFQQQLASILFAEGEHCLTAIVLDHFDDIKGGLGDNLRDGIGFWRAGVVALQVLCRVSIQVGTLGAPAHVCSSS